ncbi:exosome non-catalytic core subunit rrp40 [Malassezia cuniculi]|uniref:Ribosomal RNA-processing protein 40 n=1 Tax=Malassezia cuniculi TaxID=948313 RepID=A0AAF0F1C9_9BASI|nr:exosome non-catalytic core subunit rrp40 [Malassezia cuniculi]
MVTVLPGDTVPDTGPSYEQVKVGPGLLPTPQDANIKDEPAGVSLTAIRGGALGHVEAQKRLKVKGEKQVLSQHGWWVESAGRRYVPSANDHVIGQVTNRGTESYTVSLFSAHSATLPVLAFEGASRRTRPNISIGAIVYARIVSAPMWAEPEITCVDPVTSKSGGLGELRVDPKEGVAMLWPVSLPFAQSLTRPGHTLLSRIAEHFPLEVAVGVNGLVWCRTANAEQAVAVGKVLQAADKAALGARARTRASTGDEDEMDVDKHEDDQDEDDEDETHTPDGEMRSLNARISRRGQLSEHEIARFLTM